MTSLINDLIMAAFKPTKFYTERFLLLDKTRIQLLGFLGVLFGLVFGNLITYGLSTLVGQEFMRNPETYLNALKSLDLAEMQFVELLAVQKTYSLLLVALSPLIGYMAPHLFGSAVFGLLWLLMPAEREKLNLHRVMDLASISLCSMLFYMIPGVGPLIAVTMVAINISTGLRFLYSIVGFMKASCVMLAVYICFFLSAASLQLLAYPFAKMFQ